MKITLDNFKDFINGNWDWDEKTATNTGLVIYPKDPKNRDIGEGKLTKEDIDELTQEILNHLPYNYTDEEAHQYEQDYIKAYNELKAMREGKKNLWDKILDILAGGVQETPAQRVKMMRWIENER